MMFHLKQRHFLLLTLAMTMLAFCLKNYLKRKRKSKLFKQFDSKKAFNYL